MNTGSSKLSQRCPRAISNSDLSNVLVVVVLLALCQTVVGAQPRIHPEKVTVQFLATSTVYRTTWGMNEDIDLAELVLLKGQERFLVRLIDEYYNWSPPISATALKSVPGLGFYVVQDKACDMPYGQILLRTAPGDPMAVLPERLGFNPQLEKVPESGTVLPCYRTMRRKREGRIVRLLSAIVCWR